MSVPRLKLCFDIGRGSPELVDIPTLLMTHGHLDHSAGIPYHISQRCLRRLPAVKIYTPPELEPPLRKILQLWCEIEGYQTDYELIPLDYETTYPLSGNLRFQAIPSIHRVPSNGYTILESVRKLKDEV